MADEHTPQAINSPTPANQLPMNYGVLLYPAFQALDVFGPLDALNILSLKQTMNLSIIGPTLDPISTKPRNPSLNPKNSNFGESILPTHSITNPPPNLDVLVVPGGYGVRDDDITPIIDFIRTTYPSLKYLITVCTGSWLAAKAGVLDGKKATSNKASWAGTKVWGPNVHWVPHARWVVDGNIWTSSGVAAGIDVTLAFIREVYGEEVGKDVGRVMEYDPHTDASWDPFAEVYNLTE
ncbi:hypothetical protein V5O48_016641 [Marasmius crinis-equi]|uniref:DJ-1/PfpI domain-containing protein n=1 Tax=Marasmius crinis-equi TaxID=585013 RepID=A0ABR3ERE4_9AGAR